MSAVFLHSGKCHQAAQPVLDRTNLQMNLFPDVYKACSMFIASTTLCATSQGSPMICSDFHFNCLMLYNSIVHILPVQGTMAAGFSCALLSLHDKKSFHLLCVVCDVKSDGQCLCTCPYIYAQSVSLFCILKVIVIALF